MMSYEVKSKSKINNFWTGVSVFGQLFSTIAAPHTGSDPSMPNLKKESKLKLLLKASLEENEKLKEEVEELINSNEEAALAHAMTLSELEELKRQLALMTAERQVAGAGAPGGPIT
jgi:hypothetical protein